MVSSKKKPNRTQAKITASNKKNLKPSAPVKVTKPVLNVVKKTLVSKNQITTHKKPAKSPVISSGKPRPPEKPNIPAKLNPVSSKTNFQKADLPMGAARPWLRFWVKDPYWIFASWELPEAILKPYQKDLQSGGKTILRIYDREAWHNGGKESGTAIDLDVGHANSWYVQLWKDNLSVIGSIGIQTASGRFIPLVQSNAIKTPRAGVSPRKEQIWVEIKDKPQAPYVWVTKKTTRRGFERRRIYFSDEELRRYYSEQATSLQGLFGQRISEFIKGGFSTDTQHLNFSELYKSQLAGGSELSFDVSGSAHLGASESTSSFSKRSQTGQFFFELNADVHIYGKTEPNAEVWLGNRQIKLNQDGTFSLQYALPDMTIPLSFKAIASDRQEEREIDTTIHRSSAYRIPLTREGQGHQ